MIEQVRQELLTAEIDMRLHPEGFVQVKGLPSGQLHVWHESLPRYADEDTLHDHVWDLRSQVLVGTQVDEDYAFYVEPEADWQQWCVVDLDALYKTQTSCVDSVATDRPGLGGTAIAPAGVYGYVARIRRIEVPAGESYLIPRRMFHRSLAVPGTATLTHKAARLEGEQPRVLAKRGHSPDRSPESPEFGADLLWNAVEEVVFS